MRTLEKILNYSLFIKPDAALYALRLKVQEHESPVEIKFTTIMELEAMTSILRNEANTFYDPTMEMIIIEWEPIGENDPKYGQQHH